MWCWRIFRLWKLKHGRKLVGKLNKACIENVEEAKIAEITLTENINKCSFAHCTLCCFQ